MANFTNIRKVLFPSQALTNAFDFMRSVGRQGYEAVALFAGRIHENVYHIRELYIPKQESIKTEYGLMYKVSTDELSKLDDWLYENRLTLFCQMHTHPGEAYHSAADDANCIVTSIGGISIVIPDFARDEINTHNWAVYRLNRDASWAELDSQEVSALIHII
jgi:hypothetical protein